MEDWKFGQSNFSMGCPQNVVNGKLSIKLLKGNVVIEGRASPNSLYDENLSTFEDDDGSYDQRDAEGFIKINSLRLRKK